MEKKKYIEPFIERIILDNEISLVMQSTEAIPPVGPGEEFDQSPVFPENSVYLNQPG